MQSHVSSVSLLGAISTVTIPLDVITSSSKTLLPLQETGVSNVAGIRRVYSEKPKVGVFLRIHPDILHKNILSFLTSPVINDTLRAYRLRSAFWWRSNEPLQSNLLASGGGSSWDILEYTLHVSNLPTH